MATPQIALLIKNKMSSVILKELIKRKKYLKLVGESKRAEKKMPNYMEKIEK